MFYCTMKRFLILAIALILTLPAFAQVGRYKDIKVLYPGYTLKFDTATGELTAVHYDNDQLFEEVILKKLSHDPSQIGRYEFRRMRRVGTYQIFDTVTGEYTTVKWKPLDKNGKEVEADIDTAVTNAVEKMKKILKGLEDKLDRTQKDTSVVV